MTSTALSSHDVYTVLSIACAIVCVHFNIPRNKMNARSSKCYCVQYVPTRQCTQVVLLEPRLWAQVAGNVLLNVTAAVGHMSS